MPDNTQQEFQLFFTPKQTVALDLLDNEGVDEMLYGGAKGGGKSVFLCQWAYLQASKLIELFGIPEKPDFILPVGFLGRKRGVDFTKTTLETWKKVIPASRYRIRIIDKEIVIDNRVKLFFGGMDDESNVNKMNSAEFAFICMDQAEEMNQDDLGLLKGTLRLKYKMIQPDYKILLTANPAPCFLKPMYIDNPPTDGTKVFVQALPSDNPFLDEKYVSRLYDAFKHRPELVKAYVHGSWNDLEGMDVLIKGFWVKQCVENEMTGDDNIRLTSADVARFGNDETVIYNMVDRKIVAENISGMNNVETNATRIIRMAIENNSQMIVIDGDGFGGGVVDMVRGIVSTAHKDKMFVYEINSGKKATNDEKYANSKTEMWFYAGDLMAEKKVGIPDDPLLVQDLSSIKYKNGPNGQFMVESKKDVRRRLSRSPDRADAAVYGWWAHQYVPVKKYDYSRRDGFFVEAKVSPYGWSELPGFTSAKTRSGGKDSGYGWAR